MSIESRTKMYGDIFPNWMIAERIGSGSGGRSVVFRMQRKGEGWQTLREEGALKVVNVIEEEGHYNLLSEQFKRDYGERSKTLCRQAEKEVELMYKLRGCANIVDYLDYSFKEWKDSDGYGYDLLIRMELLSNLRDEIRSGRNYTEPEIIKIGKDICHALVACHQNKILHRDIKPENIFFNERKDFKLGDFGISRIINGSRKANTRIATWEYAAPEQFAQTGNKDYDFSVDIYSLGLVLYELSNGNRLPFASSSYLQEGELELRISGKTLPEPSMASEGFAKVILKACAYRPEDRYRSAKDFLEALLALDTSSENDCDEFRKEPENTHNSGQASEDGDPYRTEPAQENFSYEKEDADIIKDISITPEESQKGCQKVIMVRLPEGDDNRLAEKRLEITVPAGMRSGNKIRIRGKGKFRRDGSRGDLYLKVAVMPKKSDQKSSETEGKTDFQENKTAYTTDQKRGLRIRNIFIAVSVILSGLFVYMLYSGGGEERFPAANICFGLLLAALQVLGIVGMVHGKKKRSMIYIILYAFGLWACIFGIMIEIDSPSSSLTFLIGLIAMFVLLPAAIKILGKARRFYRVD